MKAELRPKPHSQIPGAIVVEVWHGGELIGTVTGSDGPGIRFQSKHVLEVMDRGGGISCVEVTAVMPHRQ